MNLSGEHNRHGHHFHLAVQQYARQHPDRDSAAHDDQCIRQDSLRHVSGPKKSVTSRWVRAEATLADRNKTLVPCMIEACERPIMFELTKTAELSHWQGDATDKAWLTFVAGVRRFVAKEAALRGDNLDETLREIAAEPPKPAGDASVPIL